MEETRAQEIEQLRDHVGFSGVGVHQVLHMEKLIRGFGELRQRGVHRRVHAPIMRPDEHETRYSLGRPLSRRWSRWSRFDVKTELGQERSNGGDVLRQGCGK